MKLKVNLFIMMLFVTLLVVACNNTAPKAVDIGMPKLSEYTVVNLKDMQGYFAGLIETATAKSRPDIALLVKFLDTTTRCYQEQGAAQLQAYSAKKDPMTLGAVVIADENRVTDPNMLVKCGLAFASAGLSNSYTLEKGESKFYVTYFCTAEEVCQDFCRELEGCKE